MLELTGVASILRGASFLYWLFAIALLILVVWKVKRWAYKAIGIAVVVGLFGYQPVQSLLEAQAREAYSREAWAYFKKLCDEKSGEKIYKTFTGVKSVLVVKPLPPATGKDLQDQFWYGDPYSNATPSEKRAESAALKLASQSLPIAFGQYGPGFDFVESIDPDRDGGSKKFIRYSYSQEREDAKEIDLIDRSVSRFAISWEDTSTPADRKYWVARSHLRLIDLTDNSVIAERIGFLIEAGFGSAGQRLSWLAGRGPNTTCPEAHDFSDRWFILKVLKPTEDKRNGK